MTTTFLLIRHAATSDLDVRLSGRRPGVTLTQEGRAQADRLAVRLKDAAIDLVVASPLDRARQTAAAIGRAKGLAVAADDALLEIDVGEWTGAAFSALRDDPRWKAWNERRAIGRCPGGETMGAAQARIVGLMRGMLSAHAGETVALVTHSDLIRAAVCEVLGLSLDAVHRFDVDPASITTVTMGDWGARLIGLNEGGA